MVTKEMFYVIHGTNRTSFLETFDYTFFHTLVKNDIPLPLPTTS